MGKTEEGAIEVFCRIKPTPKAANCFIIHPLDHKIEFVFPKSVLDLGYVNNTRERYEFKFSDIFSTDAKQDEVFEKVGRKAILSVLDGFNSTIFAYGQTGSGKTFSMTGGPEKYADRGLIPRSLQLIFNEFKKRTDCVYSAYISYLEIYNEQAYDLLHPDSQKVQSVHDLPKVSVLENNQGEFILQNLSTRMATNEEEGLNILFLGDTNRAVAETPMNLESSRSHCIFTVNVTAQVPGSDIRRRSKLHLVDLAGSERVWKSNADGSVLQEAKFINKSLHYLERVILSLHEAVMHPTRQIHIPYRDSLMTTLLRDSLGGNCKTTMLATISVEKDNLDETISTCRFAQRVGMIRNKAFVNEETDPQLVIRRLKKEIYELKQELAMLSGNGDRGPLTESEIDRCRRQVNEFCQEDTDVTMLPLDDMAKIRQCFIIFRDIVLDMRRDGPQLPAIKVKKPDPVPIANDPAASVMADQLKKIQVQLQQRDMEINILLNMIKKSATQVQGQGQPQSSDVIQLRRVENSEREQPGPFGHATSVEGSLKRSIDVANKLIMDFERQKRTAVQQAPGTSINSPSLPPKLMQSNQPIPTLSPTVPRRAPEPSTAAINLATSIPSVTASVSSFNRDGNVDSEAEKVRIFEEFKRTYPKAEAMEENKKELKSKYAEAKTLGTLVNESRDNINKMKSLLEQKRLSRAVSSVAEQSNPAILEREEEELKGKIEDEKAKYKDSFNKLRDMKGEIESLQAMLERGRVRMQADFDQYYAIILRQQSASMNSASTSGVTLPKIPSALAPGSNHNDAWVLKSIQSPTTPRHEGGLKPTPPTIPPPQEPSRAGPSLTGNPEADKEIAAFYEAREKLLRGSIS
eukprot:TRINITY_DN703_c0_g3_i5.p1 TRINITY_DN703_c0_g3~~TRINITY_DN703_c0_g3_i5.p1  ORF type:complete len:860 (-),score=162.25 TRINITY_DN703_c0_g3_i5:1427-4006(-)